MGLYMSGHAVVIEAQNIVIEEREGFLCISAEEGYSRVQFSLTDDAADDLSKRLEAYLQDKQLRARQGLMAGANGVLQIDS